MGEVAGLNGTPLCSATYHWRSPVNRTDNFTRANSTTTLGTPSDGGSAWNPLNGTWGINSNAGYEPGNTVQAVAVLDSTTTDVTVQCTFTQPGSVVGLVIRATDNANYIIATFQSGGAFLFTNVGGSFSLLTTVTQAIAPGDIGSLQIVGTALTLKLNGTTVLTATTATNPSGTLHGIYTSTDTSVRFNTFSISDGTPPPPGTNRGLINTSFTYWEYRPASGGDLSRLTFWMEPRNVLLYDAAADAALIWLQANTPSALMF